MASTRLGRVLLHALAFSTIRRNRAQTHAGYSKGLFATCALIPRAMSRPSSAHLETDAAIFQRKRLLCGFMAAGQRDRNAVGRRAECR